MNRIRATIGTDEIECAFPPAREGLVLAERLRCFVPKDLFASKRRGRAARVLTDYPGAGAKLVNYVLREGLAPTLEKTRTKLDQQNSDIQGLRDKVNSGVAFVPNGGGQTTGVASTQPSTDRAVRG